MPGTTENQSNYLHFDVDLTRDMYHWFLSLSTGLLYLKINLYILVCIHLDYWFL